MESNIFIGSASESLDIAQALQAVLRRRSRDYFPEVWNQGVIAAGRYTMPELIQKLSLCHFAIFLFSADDTTHRRGADYKTARDNVVMELGLAMGVLGPNRCFILREEGVTLPSDLSGVTTINYNLTRCANLDSELSCAVYEFETAVSKIKQTPSRVSWDAYWQSLRSLHRWLSHSPTRGGFRYDAIIAISRGGGVTADLLCRLDTDEKSVICVHPVWHNDAVDFCSPYDYELFTVIERINHRNLLLVDDISRTGKTLLSLKEQVQNWFPDSDIRCAAAFVGDAPEYCPEYYGQITDQPLTLCMPYDDRI